MRVLSPIDHHLQFGCHRYLLRILCTGISEAIVFVEGFGKGERGKHALLDWKYPGVLFSGLVFFLSRAYLKIKGLDFRTIFALGGRAALCVLVLAFTVPYGV